MHPGIVLQEEMESAMAGRRMEHHALGMDGGALRRSPWRMRSRRNLAATERGELLLVQRVGGDLGAERFLAGKIAAMAIEVFAAPLFHRAADTPAAGQEVTAVARRDHGEGAVADQGDQQTVGAAAKRNPRKSGGLVVAIIWRCRVHAAVLPSTASAATSSAETSSSTALG